MTALVVCVLLAIIATLLGLRSPMVHQYEYQEDVYVSLDGTASVYVSASLPARCSSQSARSRVAAARLLPDPMEA